MSAPRSWSGGSGRQVDMSRRQSDKVRWSWKVTEMGKGTDKDEKGKKGGCTMTSIFYCGFIWLLRRLDTLDSVPLSLVLSYHVSEYRGVRISSTQPDTFYHLQWNPRPCHL